MSKIYVSVNRDQVKQKYFEHVFGKIVSGITGCESKLAGPLAAELGVNFKNQLAAVESGSLKNTFVSAYIGSLVKTIDRTVDRWGIEHNDMIRTEDSKAHLALEAAFDEIETEEDVDGLGSTLSDMVNEMLDKKVGEIKDIAKLVLKIEKTKQESDKESELEENEEIEEEDGLDEETPEGFAEGEEESGEEPESDDGENPFGEETSEDGEGEDNPFGSTEGEPSSDNEGGNPFDDTDEGTEDDTSDDNPFGGDTDASAGDESNSGNPFDSNDGSKNSSNDTSADEGSTQEGNGNPFESVDQIKLGNSIPFAGLSNGHLTAFVTGFTRKIYEGKMRDAFDQYGAESAEFKQLTKVLKKTNRAGLEAVISVVLASEALGLAIDKEKVKNYDLFLL